MIFYVSVAIICTILSANFNKEEIKTNVDNKTPITININDCKMIK